MLAVYLGAEIIQHIGEHNRDAFNKKYVIAEIVTEEGKSTKVPSYHHQGIAAKGMPKDDIKIIATQQVLVTPQTTVDLLEGFTSTMVNSDQAVELVQWFSTEDNRITATQFHPEFDDQEVLPDTVIKAAIEKAYKQWKGLQAVERKINSENQR
jgi:gamma-glutamyl-gamma-aminobutyrate hydrolase PuuD